MSLALFLYSERPYGDFFSKPRTTTGNVKKKRILGGEHYLLRGFGLGYNERKISERGEVKFQYQVVLKREGEHWSERSP